jgi:hypothetical protein
VVNVRNDREEWSVAVVLTGFHSAVLYKKPEGVADADTPSCTEEDKDRDLHCSVFAFALGSPGAVDAVEKVGAALRTRGVPTEVVEACNKAQVQSKWAAFWSRMQELHRRRTATGVRVGVEDTVVLVYSGPVTVLDDLTCVQVQPADDSREDSWVSLQELMSSVSVACRVCVLMDVCHSNLPSAFRGVNLGSVLDDATVVTGWTTVYCKHIAGAGAGSSSGVGNSSGAGAGSSLGADSGKEDSIMMSTTPHHLSVFAAALIRALESSSEGDAPPADLTLEDVLTSVRSMVVKQGQRMQLADDGTAGSVKFGHLGSSPLPPAQCSTEGPVRGPAEDVALFQGALNDLRTVGTILRQGLRLFEEVSWGGGGWCGVGMKRRGVQFCLCNIRCHPFVCCVVLCACRLRLRIGSPSLKRLRVRCARWYMPWICLWSSVPRQCRRGACWRLQCLSGTSLSW